MLNGQAWPRHAQTEKETKQTKGTKQGFFILVRSPTVLLLLFNEEVRVRREAACAAHLLFSLFVPPKQEDGEQEIPARHHVALLIKKTRGIISARVSQVRK